MSLFPSATLMYVFHKFEDNLFYIFHHPPNLTSCFIQKCVLQSLLKVYMNKSSSIVLQQVNYTIMEWFLFYCSIGSIKRQNICQDAANIDIIHTFKVQDVRQVNEKQISFENFECFDKYLQNEVFPGQCFAPLKGKYVNWLCRQQEK